MIEQLIPSGELMTVWLIRAVLTAGAIGLVVSIVSPLLAGIPFVGPLLAGVFASVASQYRAHLEDLPLLAEEAVDAVESASAAGAKAAGSAAGALSGPQKKEAAVELVRKSAPARVARDAAETAVEAAHNRLRADGREQRIDELLGELTKGRD